MKGVQVLQDFWAGLTLKQREWARGLGMAFVMGAFDGLMLNWVAPGAFPWKIALSAGLASGARAGWLYAKQHKLTEEEVVAGKGVQLAVRAQLKAIQEIEPPKRPRGYYD